MIPTPVGGSIHVAAGTQTALRHGDMVVLHVIKRLEGDKWAVGIGGRVYPAVSRLALETGATLRARVDISPGKLTLTVSEIVEDAVMAALQGQGMPGTEAELAIARALARTGLPIHAQTIQKIRQLLSREGVDLKNGARAAATLVDKGFDPGSDAARTLLPVLGFGQKGGGDPRRYKRKPLPQSAKAVRGFVDGLATDPAESPTTLQAYNHIRGRTESWIVLPFSFSADRGRDDFRHAEDPLRPVQGGGARDDALHAGGQFPPPALRQEARARRLLRHTGKDACRPGRSGQLEVKNP